MLNKIPGVQIDAAFGDMPVAPELPSITAPLVEAPLLPQLVSPPQSPIQAPPLVMAAAPKASAPVMPMLNAMAPQAQLPQTNVLPFKPLQMPAPQINQAEPILLPPASADLASSMQPKSVLPARVEKVIELPAKSDKGIEARKAINANTSISPTKPEAVPRGGLMQSFQNQSNAMNPNQRPGTHVETLNINTSKPMTPLELENMMAMAVGG